MFILTPLHGKGTLAVHHAQGNLGTITIHPRILGNNVTVRPSAHCMQAKVTLLGTQQELLRRYAKFCKPRCPPPPPIPPAQYTVPIKCLGYK